MKCAGGALRAKAHVREFLADTLTPLGVFRRLQGLSDFRFLLESVTGGEQVSRFSFAGAAPNEVLWLYEDRLLLSRAPDLDKPEPLPGDPLPVDPLTVMRERMESITSERCLLADTDVPLVGGWVGYFGWDLVRLLEKLPARPQDDFGLPVALMARFDEVVVMDHARQRILLIANEIEGEYDAAHAERRLDQLAVALESTQGAGALAVPQGELPPADLSAPTLTDEQYQDAVIRAKKRIAAGDIFQVVPSRRWEVKEKIAPLALYRALRMVNPSPYMVLFETPDVALVGGSPEVLVKVQGDTVSVRPIAGTRPRGETPEADLLYERELLEDPKEIAEHVMLVDLGRNDLGRVGAPGTVEVTDFMVVERYSHVMHIVSNVQARRAEGRSALDALFACFPAGTLSGAPKVRAMEIIDELENSARGPYGGAVGYLSFNGDLDTCITIRTLVVQPHRTTVTAGAGLVADSDPQREQQETKDKAAALLRAVALAKKLQASHPEALNLVSKDHPSERRDASVGGRALVADGRRPLSDEEEPVGGQDLGGAS